MTTLTQTENSRFLPPTENAVVAARLAAGVRLRQDGHALAESDPASRIATHRYARCVVRELPRIEPDDGTQGWTW